MFGFGKKKTEKKKSKIDKLIMGAIVGGAVGSVIGMTIAPQKGKETRDLIAQKGKELIQKGHESLDKFSEAQENNKIMREAAQRKKNFFNRMKDRLFGSKKKMKKDLNQAEMKEIPYE